MPEKKYCLKYNPKKVVFLMVGFSSIFNAALFPESSLTVRLTDVVVLLILIYFVFFPGKVFIEKKYLLLMFFGMVPVFLWVVIGTMSGDIKTVFPGVRIISGYLCSAFIVMKWRGSVKALDSLLKGMVAGGVLLTLVSIGQKFNIHPLFLSLKPAGVNDWWVLGNIRVTGLYEHPNGLSHISSLAAAAAVALSYLNINKVLNICLFLFIIIGTYMSTFTRAGILIGVFILFLYALRSEISKVKFFILLAMLVAAILSPFYLVDLMGDRWLSQSVNVTLFENIMDRLMTTIKTMEYILQNPLGYGVGARHEVLSSDTGAGATHNSILSVGMSFGIITMAAYIASFIWSLISFYRIHDERACLAILISVVLASFLIEDVVYSPSFTVIFPLLISFSFLRRNNDGGFLYTCRSSVFPESVNQDNFKGNAA